MGAGRFFGTANAMKPIVKLLLIVPILLWSSVAAADFRAGAEAYKRGDYATAYQEWLPLAEQGNADAQFSLGGMYAGGEGVPEDDAAAAKSYRKARAPSRGRPAEPKTISGSSMPRAKACRRIMSGPLPGSILQPRKEMRMPKKPEALSGKP